ncbi:non-ribosomal peptide synthetase, partial [Actinoalloteichus spitiensis]|uniref:non-ribosomal peptide synthetase n=1 Tax=Actinoalloteichus spitiensis TaxID=252394 RepID=UPI0003770193
EALPLTGNGKVDRAALPEPGTTREGEHVEPRTDLERTLCSVWADVLGVERVGATDSFFDLGGHSLAAIRVVSRVRAVLDVEIPLRALFESPTPRGLASWVEGADRAASALTPTERPAEIPLSFAQRRLWFVDQVGDTAGSYNVPLALRLTGPLDVDALLAALRDVLVRHEALRTVFPAPDGRPVQRVVPVEDLHVELPTTVVEERTLAKSLAAAAIEGFDLAREVPLRARLFAVNARTNVLLLVLHHIAADAWSLSPFTRDLATAYAARAAGLEPRWEPLPVQYADYTLWQRRVLGQSEETGSRLADGIAWWRDTLAGAPDTLALPADRPRPRESSHQGGAVEFVLPAALHESVTRLARDSSASVFMVLQAAVAALLTRMGAGTDIPLGAPVAGRSDDKLNDLVGFFVNTLVLRTDTAGDPTFRELLDRVRTADLRAFAHQDVPFEELVEAISPARSLGRHPLFQVMVSVTEDATRSWSLPGVECQPESVESTGSKVDLEIVLADRRSPDSAGDGVRGVVAYAADLFDESTARSLADRLVRLLTAVADDPSLPLSEVDLLSAEERARLTTGWNATDTDVPWVPYAEIVERVAATRPDATALVCGPTALSYRELDVRANRLAHLVARLGAGPETRVALLLPRSVDQVVATLAVLKAGAVYLPIDPSHPSDRIEYMVRDSGSALLLTRTDVTAGTPAPTGPLVVELDTAETAAELDTHPGEHPPHTRVLPGSGAYVIYTSGSTGWPKGVLVSHAGVAALAGEQPRRFGLDPASRVLQLASPSFDAAVMELLMAFASGGTLVVPAAAGPLAGEELAAVLAENQITHALVSPSALASLPPVELPRLRTLLTGGEACGPDLVRRWSPGRTMINAYGPTETTVVTSTSRPLAATTGTPPIGTPIPGTRVFVLDERLRPVPPGVDGDLYVSGLSLARGYLNRPGLTGERFVANPYAQDGSRLYRTGDVVRWLPTGQLRFSGRSDDQVKLRGFRIELGEIENVLRRHPLVGDAVVVLRTDDPGAARLAAYLTPPADGTVPGSDVLRDHTRAVLPDFMVPAAFVVLDELPLTVHGKLDRQALPRPEFDAVTAYAAPRDETERTLCAVWAEVLKVDRVGVTDNFFDLGGDSILSIQVVAQARRAGLVLSSRDIFLRQTVGALAAGMSRTPTAGVGTPVPRGPVSGPVEPTPVLSWFLQTHPVAPHHFAMSTAFDLPESLDLAAFQTAVTAVLTQHDALRLVIDRDPQGAWAPRILPDLEAASVLEVVNTVGVTDPEQAWQDTVTTAQSGMDLATGPLLRVVLARTPRGWRVALVAHHAVVDGVSWRVLLSDLDTAYHQARTGNPVDLGERTSSMGQWTARLAEHTRSGGFTDQLDYWTTLLSDPGVVEIPVDHPGGPNTVEHQDRVEVELDTETTRAVLSEVPAVYRTQVNDVLLAVVGRVLTRWAGRDRVAVALEGHGREELFEGVDLSRTVGWFTSVYPVVLQETGQGWAATVLGVKEALRAVPDRGVGYQALRYTGGAAELVGQPVPGVSVNYHGVFHLDTDQDGGSLFGVPVEVGGREHAPGEERAYLLDVVGGVVQGRLRFSWWYSTGVFERATVVGLARAVVEGLREFVGHCRRPGVGGASPSDFPLVALDQAGVDHLLDTVETSEVVAGVGRGGGVADVYPLTPLQAGMVFHAVADPGSGAYVEQFSCVVEGVADPEVLGRAWQRVVAGSDALRVSVVWEGVAEPVQVVHRVVRVPVTVVDWSGLAEERRAEVLAEFLVVDRERGLDVGVAPLMRLFLAREGAGRVRVVWTFHHLLLDGWSMFQFLADVFAEHSRLHADRTAHDLAGSGSAATPGTQGTPGAAPDATPGAPTGRPRRPYRDYVEWLVARDRGESLDFWRRTLSGFDEPTP